MTGMVDTRPASPDALPLCAEDALLLLCARPRLTPAQQDRVRALAAGGVDWDALLDAASWHGVVPLLTQHLFAVRPKALPTSTVGTLRAWRETVARTNRLQALEAARLLGLFKQQGIAAVGLKGPILAASVYGNLALRDFGDLDILVHRRARSRAHRVLLAEGYRVCKDHSPDIIFFKYLALAHYHNAYEHSRTAARVELHWRISPRFISVPLDSSHFWQRLEPRRLLSTTVPDLAAEDLLVYMCLHGSKHVWRKLKYVCDIAACLERYPDLDWLQVMERARELHCERMVYLALDLAYRLLDIALPEPVIAAIGRDPAVTALGTHLAARLLRRQDINERAWGIEMVRYWLQFKSRPRDRLLIYPYLAYFAWRVLRQPPSHKDRALLRLPAHLAPLYYVVRPIRLGALATRLGARAVTGRLRRGPDMGIL